MTKQRKPLNQILEQFEENSEITTTSSIDKSQSTDANLEAQSLTAQLANPKRKNNKIRFTLDLEKALDDRLVKASKQLNRTKADLARIAIMRLLDELDNEQSK